MKAHTPAEESAKRITWELDHGPLRTLQIWTIFAAVLTNIIDGFDILSMSFVAPTVALQWGLGPERVGFLLSASLAGMGIGALGLSWLVDVFGRRGCTIMCLMLMATGMFLAAYAPTVELLALARLVTGMGVGWMNASAGTLAVEYAPLRYREMAVGAVVLGYPAGAMLGGGLAVWLLTHIGWEAVFLFGGFVSLTLIPVFALFVPESVHFLLARQPKNALRQINATLAKLKVAPLEALPPRPQPKTATGARALDILIPPLLWRTLPVCFAYFLYMMSHYFILSWVPKLLSQAGFSVSGSIGYSVLINLGGMAGGAAIGVITPRIGLRAAAMSSFLAMAALIALFGWAGSATGPELITICLVLGFCQFASTTCVFSLAAGNFTPSVRGIGVGVSTSAGRLGSVCGVYLAGVLLSFGVSTQALCAILALPAVGAALMAGKLATDAAHRARNAVTTEQHIQSAAD